MAICSRHNEGHNTEEAEEASPVWARGNVLGNACHLVLIPEETLHTA